MTEDDCGTLEGLDDEGRLVWWRSRRALRDRILAVRVAVTMSWHPDTGNAWSSGNGDFLDRRKVDLIDGRRHRRSARNALAADLRDSPRPLREVLRTRPRSWPTGQRR